MDDLGEQGKVYVLLCHRHHEGGFVVGVAATADGAKALADKDNLAKLPLVWQELPGTGRENFRVRWSAECNSTEDYIVEEWGLRL